LLLGCLVGYALETLSHQLQKKIAIGMGIAALAFVVMVIGSFGLPLYSEVSSAAGGTPLTDAQRVTPFLLLGTLFYSYCG